MSEKKSQKKQAKKPKGTPPLVPPQGEKKKRKKGRPTKFGRVILRQLEMLYTAGHTDLFVAKFLNVTERTLRNWMEEKPEFFQSIRNWKITADERVEKALYDRAIGYSHPAVKLFNEKGTVIEHEYIEHYPPDYNSMELWLTNRNPDNWRKKFDVESGGKPVASVTTFVVPGFDTSTALSAGKPIPTTSLEGNSDANGGGK